MFHCFKPFFKKTPVFFKEIFFDFFKRAVIFVAMTFGVAGFALAAIPEGITAALSEAKADVVTIGGLALVVVVAIAAFKYMRRGI